MTVFCDVDGTLLDSSARHEQLLRDLLREGSIAWPDDAPEYLPYKADGHSTREWLETAGVKRPAAEKVAAVWQARIELPEYLATDRPYPDAIPFLQALHRLKVRVILLSARQDEAALRMTLQHWELLSLVDELLVVPPRCVADEKAAILRVRAVGGDVMIGDTEADMTAADLAGIRCLVLDRGFRSRRYWRQRGVASLENLRAVYVAITAPDKKE